MELWPVRHRQRATRSSSLRTARRDGGQGARPAAPGATERTLRSRGGPMPFNNIISRPDAQALIPDEVVNEVVKAAAAESAALSLFRRVDMGTKYSQLPVM